MISTKQFQKTILDYYAAHGRKLPWRASPTPYTVLVSEIMLQQTQAERVVPKFREFLKLFPTFKALAKAPLTTVLQAWSGLGYNRRAINLQKLAQIVINKHKGKLPNDLELLDALPGIGQATAGAILTYAFNKAQPFIETNVRSVYIHFFFHNKEKVTDEKLWPLILKTWDTKNPRRWGNALMDYGVKLKKEFKNPSRKSKHYTIQSKFEGSNRQLRGKMLKLLIGDTTISAQMLQKKTGATQKQIAKNLAALKKEGFILFD